MQTGPMVSHPITLFLGSFLSSKTIFCVYYLASNWQLPFLNQWERIILKKTFTIDSLTG